MFGVVQEGPTQKKSIRPITGAREITDISSAKLASHDMNLELKKNLTPFWPNTTFSLD